LLGNDAPLDLTGRWFIDSALAMEIMIPIEASFTNRFFWDKYLSWTHQHFAAVDSIDLRRCKNEASEA